MDANKRKALEAAGYRVGDYGDFMKEVLGASQEEVDEVESRLSEAKAAEQRDVEAIMARYGKEDKK